MNLNFPFKFFVTSQDRIVKDSYITTLPGVVVIDLIEEEIISSPFDT